MTMAEGSDPVGRHSSSQHHQQQHQQQQQQQPPPHHQQPHYAAYQQLPYGLPHHLPLALSLQQQMTAAANAAAANAAAAASAAAEHNSSPHHNNNSANSKPWKQRKRKRLSAVLDKLHNNNTHSLNNNLADCVKQEAAHCAHHSSSDGLDGLEGLEGLERRPCKRSNSSGEEAESEDLSRGDGGSPHLSVSPLQLLPQDGSPTAAAAAAAAASQLHVDTKPEQLPSPYDRYFPIPSPLFGYYLHTKYLNEVFRRRHDLYHSPLQHTPSSLASSAADEASPPGRSRAAGHLDHPPPAPPHRAPSATPAASRDSPSHAAAAALPSPPHSESSSRPSPSPAVCANAANNADPSMMPPPQDRPLDLSLRSGTPVTEAAAKKYKPPSPLPATTMMLPPSQHPVPAAVSVAAHMPPGASNASPVSPYASLHSAHAAAAAAAAAMIKLEMPLHALHHHATNSGVGVPVIKGDVASPTTKESVAWRYNLDVSPVVEEMPPGADVAYVCPVCGQMFSLHDRLAKHMASRHKSRSAANDSAKAYSCEVCGRSFARSDMLTRHMRLHTGVKPYTCKVCGQVFSRSDHLSTHQRTHTGEKPYKCPQCPYAACRRDMITRHMRTHTRYEAQQQRAASSNNGNNNGSNNGNNSLLLSGFGGEEKAALSMLGDVKLNVPLLVKSEELMRQSPLHVGGLHGAQLPIVVKTESA